MVGIDHIGVGHDVVVFGHDVRSIVHTSWPFTLKVRLVEKNCVSDLERVTFPERNQLAS